MKRISILFLLLMLMGSAPVAVAQQDDGRKKATDIFPSTVQIYQLDCEGAPAGDPTGVPDVNTCMVLGTGSGTIISPDGLILTNAHVALANWAEAVTEGPGTPETPGWLAVGLTVDPRELPVPSFFAMAVVYDAMLDLAIIQPLYDLQGNSIEQGDIALPPLTLETREKAVEIEQSVRIIGYPGPGGPTISIIPSQVTGFMPDEFVPELEGNGFIKTNQGAGPGVSGGTLVDDNGTLIGVPTQAGQTSIRCSDADGDGQNDPSTECWGMPGETGISRPVPEGFTLLLEKGFEKGQVTEDGEIIGIGNPSIDEPTDPRDNPTMPGKKTETTAVVTGQVVSADDGEPISGALVIVLKPGVTLEEAQELEANEAVFTAGETDARGNFQLEDPVERGQAYSIIFFADGYQTVAGDDIVLATADDPATVDLGTIELASER